MKLNKILVLGAVVISSLTAISCSKSFLDNSPKTPTLTQSQLNKAAKWNTQILPSQLIGNIGGQWGDLTRINLGTGISSGDVIFTANKYGWYGDWATFSSFFYNSAINGGLWSDFYTTIFLSNNFLGIVGDTGTNLPDTKGMRADVALSTTQLWGQQMFLKGYSYLNLAQLYGGVYSKNKDSLRLPIYNDSKNIIAAKPQSIATAYKEAIDLLKAAYKALSVTHFSRPDKSQIDTSVVAAYLATAYLDTGDYKSALATVKPFLNNPDYQILPLADLFSTGFFDLNASPSFLWGKKTNQQNSVGLHALQGLIDIFSYSYALAGDSKVINPSILAQLYPGDMRKLWFSNSVLLKDLNVPDQYADQVRKQLANNGLYNLLPLNKFYSKVGRDKFLQAVSIEYKDGKANVSLPDLFDTCDKTFLGDLVELRVSYFYLVAAEAAARLGLNDQAHQYLLSLLEQRFQAKDFEAVKAKVNSLTGEDLINQIYLNWRIEMWCEGNSLDVMRRFKGTVTLPKFSYYKPNRTYSYDNDSLKFSTPRSEYLLNNNFKNKN